MGTESLTNRVRTHLRTWVQSRICQHTCNRRTVDATQVTAPSATAELGSAAHIHVSRVGERYRLVIREADAIVADIDIDEMAPSQFAARYSHLLLTRDEYTPINERDVAQIFRAAVRFAANAGRIEIKSEHFLNALFFPALYTMGVTLLSSVLENINKFIYRPDLSGQSTSKLVSILIASWNPRYFEKALRSALAQTYRNIEIIVCDDSRDSAIEAIVNKYRSSPTPICYERNVERLMVRKNYERCLSRANGEYIKFLNDDDLLEPRCIERLVAALEAEPSAVLATSARSLVDAHGGPKHDMPATVPLFREDRFVDGQSLANALLMLGLNFVGEPSTALFRKDAAQLDDDEKLFEFRGATGRGVVDFTLWTRLLCRGDAVYLRERLSSFRVHAEQRQALAEVREFAIDAIPALREKWIELGLHLAVPPNVLRARPIGARAPCTYDLVPGFTSQTDVAEQLVAQWRQRQHPFFAQNACTSEPTRVSP